MTKLKLLCIGLLVIVNVVIIYFYFIFPNTNLIAFLDVGQGDSTLIQDDKLHQIIIDAGPSAKIITSLSSFVPFFDKTIDYLIITHPEKDHYFGANYLLQNFRINNLLISGAVKSSPEFEQLLKTARDNNVTIGIIKQGSIIHLNTITVETLWPLTDLTSVNLPNANNSGVVLLITAPQKKYLLLADIESVVEQQIAHQYSEKIRGAIVKIAHHGSKTSSDQKFIESISPTAAIISCGKNNSYGHPATSTLETLMRYNIPVFRTDLLGSISFSLN